MSNQIRLEAVGSAVVVADLGITLRLNEVAWVSREEMQASECLRALVTLGKVRISSGARSLVSKEPPKRRLPTAVKRSRPNGRGGAPVRSDDAPKALTHQEAQAMADRAAQKAASETMAAATAQFRSIFEGLATPSTESIEGVIERAVSQALAGAPIKTATPQANAPSSEIEDLIAGGPEEPLFIPSGIVKGSSENLSLKSESSRGAELDSSADALKALRKGKG